MTYVLGIDLGGTKVLAGVIDVDTGKVVSREKKRTRAEHGPTDIVERLMTAAEKAIQESGVPQSEIETIGIGAAGQLDRKRGIIVSAPNLAGMANMPLADMVKKRFGIDVRLYNDVEAAGGGEAAFGAGKDQPDFVVIFVGTGIGGMVYRDGRPYPGASHTAGEIGHMVVDHDGRICACGGVGHLEAYASRTAIVRYMLAAMHLGRESVLTKMATEINPNDPGGSGIRSGTIADALKQKDRLVKEALTIGAEYLGSGLCSIINFYNPPLIILGGGLIQAVDSFFEEAAQRAREMALRMPADAVEIKKAALGDYSGIVGAAFLAHMAAGSEMNNASVSAETGALPTR
jgi:glucokinase